MYYDSSAHRLRLILVFCFWTTSIWWNDLKCINLYFHGAQIYYKLRLLIYDALISRSFFQWNFPSCWSPDEFRHWYCCSCQLSTPPHINVDVSRKILFKRRRLKSIRRKAARKATHNIRDTKPTCHYLSRAFMQKIFFFLKKKKLDFAQINNKKLCSFNLYITIFNVQSFPTPRLDHKNQYTMTAYRGFNLIILYIFE